MKKEDYMKCLKICERAEAKYNKEWLDEAYGPRISRMMDLQSAVYDFNLRLDDLMAADDENFMHDVCGLWGNSDRTTYPCTFGLFVPRFAGERE